jgi:zinc transport system permease protein
MSFFELLHFGFVQRALIAGIFIGLLCSFLGVFLVLRRISLIGDGLAHVTFGSVALGLLFKIYPLYLSIPITLLCGLIIIKIIEKTKLSGDAAIGIVSSAGISIGVLIASIAGGFNVDLFSYLFGNILAITKEEVVLSIILSIFVISIVVLLYHKLVSITFDAEMAKVTGIKTNRINTIFILLIAMTIVLSMRVVGIMLVSSFLILPSVSSLQIAKSFRTTIILSYIFSTFSVLLGISLSFTMNLPTGATIVIINLFIFLILVLFKNLK